MSAVNFVCVTFDEAVYDLDTIKKSAYKFTDRLSIKINREAEGIVCELSLLDETSDLDIECLARELQNEVLDQDLRKSISKETETTRNVILAHVFSETGLQDG